MKKIYFIILVLFMLTGCENTKNVNNQVNQEVQTNKATLVCNNEYAGDTLKIATKLSKLSDFKCANITNYLNYINLNSKANYDDVIYLINKGIDKTYSSELMELVKSNYFILANLDKHLSNEQSSPDKTIAYVNAGLYRSYYQDMVATDTNKDTLMLVNKYNYLISSYVPKDLETIDANYSRGVNNKLRHVAKVAFEKMAAAAKLDNIIIFNQSAYRSYQSQVTIYNRSVASYGVEESDKTSARPGNSEHQTGLTLDINSVDNSFKNTSEYQWLIKNSYKYGFILRYPENKEEITGYAYEPWHYRYVGLDAASKINEEGITFDEYYAYYVANQ